MGFRKIFLILFFLVLICGVAGATTVDIGNPNTYHKNSIQLNENLTGKYSQFAMKWDYSQEVQINSVGLYKFNSIGKCGPYDITIVNDDNGVPGSTVYAQNLAWYNNTTASRSPVIIPLNTTFTLPANTPCWVVVDGRTTSAVDQVSLATWDIDDPDVQADGCIGLDYTRWLTSGWNGTAWTTPSTSGSNYDMYGCAWMYDNLSLVGDGQFANNEATSFSYGLNMVGLKITNAPSDAYQINNMSIRMKSVGTHGPVYLSVVDSNYTELANRSIVPTDGGSWLKQTYTFSPAIEIGAGHSTIICVIKAPQGTNSNNCEQIRGIDYVSGAKSVQNCVAFLTGSGGFSNIWTNDANADDTMMNFSVSYGAEEWDGISYYVSPTGNDSDTGQSPETPWKTLTYATSQDLDGKTLNLMDGTFEGEQLILTDSNVTVQAYSGNPTITNGTYGIKGLALSNVTIDGITSQYNRGAGIYFDGSSHNITVKNCTIIDGTNGISLWRSFDCTAQDNYVSNMTDTYTDGGHGIHIYGQDGTIQYTGNSVLRNNISDCTHNMIDVHSNQSSITISGNDVYFTDAWNYTKNNVAVYVHNGNTPYATIDNNTIHHAGRLLELNNVKDSVIKDNIIYDGLNWGSNGFSESCVKLAADDGTVPCETFGCQNLTFLRNTFDGIGYPIQISSSETNVDHSNLTFEENIFENTQLQDLRVETAYVGTNNIFKNNNFTNFTIRWESWAAMGDGNIKFQDDSHLLLDNAGDSYYFALDLVNLNIDNDVTDIWRDMPITLDYADSQQSGNKQVDFGSPLRLKYLNVSVVSRGEPGTAYSVDGSEFSTSAPITISSASAQTDYPVKIDMTYDALMQSDFDDVHFVDASGAALSYWREAKVDDTNATFWVKVPSVALGDTTIKAYYGNATASTASNGSNVFTKFDDFEDGAINAQWTVGQYVTASETGGQLVIAANGTNTYNQPTASVYLPITLTNGFEAKGSVDYTGSGTTDEGYVTLLLSESAGLEGLFGGLYDESTSLTTVPFRAEINGALTNTANHLPVSGSIVTTLQRNSTDYNKVYEGTTVVKEGTYNTQLYYLRLINSAYGTNPTKTAKWNYVYVRKMADTEPTYALGTPTTASDSTPAEIVTVDILGTEYTLLNNSTSVTPSENTQYVNFTSTSADWDYVISLTLLNSPVCDFSATPLSGDTPLAIQFTDRSTGVPTEWAWDFDNDGNIDSTSQNPEYTYTSAGTYTVNLTTTNADGSDLESKTDYISVTSTPTAEFTSDTTSGSRPLTVTFSDTSINTPTAWLWDFGDGTNSIEQNPVHEFDTRGNYTVSLRSTNTYGVDTETKTNYVEVQPLAPIAGFSASPTSGVASTVITFLDSSQEADSYAWDFENDGVIDSTLQNPTHAYTSAGTYTVNLTVSNPTGTDSEIKSGYILISSNSGTDPLEWFYWWMRSHRRW